LCHNAKEREMKMQKDVFDYIDPDETGTPDRSGMIWNILTILVLIITLVIVALVLVIFINPSVGINPFPPPTLPVRVILDTPTPTPINVLPPTWTPRFDPSATPTLTPLPSMTPEVPEDDQEAIEEPEEDLTITGDMPVVLHEGSPQYIPSTSFHPDLGCNWLGVAGQVIDLNGAPVLGLIIEVGGLLNGKRIGNPTLLQATGLATAYGDAGYEVKLADEPIASNGTLWIQVLDQAGLPLSEKVDFATYEDCERNLVVIYFKQVQ
jgi:hypothetical protein